MSSLNSPHAPSTRTIIQTANELYRERGACAVLDFLSECASHDFKCPDRCDAWAVSFYDNYADEIEDQGEMFDEMTKGTK